MFYIYIYIYSHHGTGFGSHQNIPIMALGIHNSIIVVWI